PGGKTGGGGGAPRGRGPQQPGPAGGPQAVVQVVQEHRQEEVEHQDGDEGGHEGAGGGPAHALGARLAVEAAVAADDGDGGAEERRLDQPRRQVVQVDVALGVLPVEVALDVIDLNTDQGAAQHAHEVGDDGQQRDQHDAGQEARRRQVVDGVDPQAADGVDLLGDAHRRQLGGHGAADPAREHDRGQHRAQLADDGDVDDRPQPGLQP